MVVIISPRQLARQICWKCESYVKNPVLLIHGIDDTAALFRGMAAHLQEQGWETHALDLVPNNGQVGLTELGGQVADYVRRNIAPDRSIDVVGFSMGGMVSRVYLQMLGGIKRVRRLVTISSPHNGTWSAYCRWNPGARDMRPGSPLLVELNRGCADLCRSVQVTSVWSRFDLMIVPARSSVLAGARNICVNVPAHAVMVSSRRVRSLVVEALSAD